MNRPGRRTDAEWRDLIASTAQGMRDLLAATERGDLDADTPDGRVVVRHLEGGIAALEGLLAEPPSPRVDTSHTA